MEWSNAHLLPGDAVEVRPRGEGTGWDCSTCRLQSTGVCAMASTVMLVSKEVKRSYVSSEAGLSRTECLLDAEQVVSCLCPPRLP